MRERLARDFLKGRGAEIGGLHCPLPLPEGASAYYIDRVPLEDLKRQFSDVEIKAVEYVVDNAEILDQVDDASLDFLIANHVFEHCEDVIQTLHNWLRVVKEGGIVYAAVPDKRYTFDKKRAITTISHIFRDHLLTPPRFEHYMDWYQNSELEGKTGEDLNRAVLLATERDQNIHWHVWDLDAMLELFAWLQKILPFSIETYEQNGAEVIWILRKLPPIPA